MDLLGWTEPMAAAMTGLAEIPNVGIDKLSALFLPIAFGLGALHGLEPGHAKTLTATYLIGINGKKRDALDLEFMDPDEAARARQHAASRR